ncbi:gamma-glutamyltransferase [Nocardioides sp. YIM 152588]|uniref:gamma-glutamyltransferase n=1 Tax=Nocardioides sp. YIM 152588 TaxID=3158259 RepID=UPI0032E4B450
MSRPLARRAVTTGTLGAVAAGSRTAAGIGLAALHSGGNAFDAVVSAALAETVALPSKCGLAGDVVALVRRAGKDTPSSLIALGGAAAGLYAAAEAQDWRVAPTGGLSVGVPGAPAGYDALASYGRLGRERLVAPARALAERGIIWSPLTELLAHESAELLRSHQPQGCVFAPASGPRAAGEVVRLPRMAHLLEAFADLGADLFHGDLGRTVAERVARAGGVLTVEDLRSVEVLEEPALRTTSARGPLWATRAPTYGAALADALGGRDADELTPAVVADSLARQSRGEPVGAEGTSTVAAADAEGNAVVLVHSNSFPQFGSGLVVEDLDLVLSNRAGRGFTFRADHPNAPTPGRRPLTTLHAWGMPTAEGDGGWLLGATPGGEQQVPWNVGLLQHLLRHGTAEAALGDALVTPRFQLSGDGSVRREGEDLPHLTARSSHTLVRWSPDRVAAAADPRWDAAAVAA